MYHAVTKDREFDIGKKERDIAADYDRAYRQLGGITAKSKLENDFLIIASASLHNLEIIVSDDNSTMLNEIAVQAYAAVNSTLKIKLPRLVRYEEFKKEIRK